VDGLIPVLLDAELVEPKEGELAAARRLLQRVLKTQGRRFDVATGDALYGDQTFLQMLRKAGKSFVVVLKDDRREVYDEANRLRACLTPRTWQADGRRYRVWDVEHLRSWWRGPKVPLRVVWSEEQSRRGARGRKRGESEWVTSTWVWLTDLPAARAGARIICHLGHRRWDIENRCFHEGVMEWGFDHRFHHDPNAIVVFLLMLGIAMIAVHTFLKRNVKESLRRLYTILSLRTQFLSELAQDLSWGGWVRAGFLDGS